VTKANRSIPHVTPHRLIYTLVCTIFVWEIRLYFHTLILTRRAVGVVHACLRHTGVACMTFLPLLLCYHCCCAAAAAITVAAAFVAMVAYSVAYSVAYYF